MECVPPRFGVDDMAKGWIGDEGDKGAFFFIDGGGGGPGGFDLIGVLSGFINLKKTTSILILIILTLCLYLTVLLLVLKFSVATLNYSSKFEIRRYFPTLKFALNSRSCSFLVLLL